MPPFQLFKGSFSLSLVLFVQTFWLLIRMPWKASVFILLSSDNLVPILWPIAYEVALGEDFDILSALSVFMEPAKDLGLAHCVNLHHVPYSVSSKYTQINDHQPPEAFFVQFVGPKVLNITGHVSTFHNVTVFQLSWNRILWSLLVVVHWNVSWGKLVSTSSDRRQDRKGSGERLVVDSCWQESHVQQFIVQIPWHVQ